MVRPRRTLPGPPARPEPLPLPEPRKQLRRYYAGESMRSPQGGMLEVVRVQPGRGERDGGRLILECSTSTLRYALEVPPASRAERAEVAAAQAGGAEAFCPRHGPGIRLLRAGALLVCPRCGVSYGRVP